MSAQASKSKQTSRWGSLLSGAVAGIESKLDTILAEDDQASARSRAAEKARQEAAQQAKGVQSEQGVSRTSSRSRPNGRLQDRLAKAVIKGGETSRPGSRPPTIEPSRTASPSLDADIARSSLDSKTSETVSEPAPTQPGAEASQDEEKISESAGQEPWAPPTLVTALPPSQPTSVSTLLGIQDKPSPRPSFESTTSSRPSPDDPTPAILSPTEPPGASPSPLSPHADELARLREDHRTELHAHLERIDALQAKLSYLARQAAETASTTASALPTGNLDRRIAEKDAQIAELLDEGQALSKRELAQLSTIKKLRASRVEEEKASTALRQRLAKAESEREEAREWAKRAEAAEKAAGERMRALARIEREVDALKVEREGAVRTIEELRRRLEEAEARAEQAEKSAQTGTLEAEMKAARELRDEIEDLRIEKKVVEDRARAEVREVKEETNKQAEKARAKEMELRGEVANLEAKLELLRARTEEATSDPTNSTQTKLLRQIETLQTQYALASENWQGIEGTLTSRVAALEKERDDAAKREADVRRKARDVNAKSRRLEQELDSVNDRAKMFEQDVQEQRDGIRKLQTRLQQAESTLEDARQRFEHDRKMWDTELQQRIAEEKVKWRAEHASSSHSSHPPTLADARFLGAESPTATSSLRKHSTPDLLGLHARRTMNRTASTDPPFLPLEHDRPPSSSRRLSTQPLRTSDAGTPRRQDSTPSLSQLNGGGYSQTPPSIQAYDHDEQLDTGSSPHRTVNDILSVSTVGAGPSVQLVERMSAAVRRLESEKAATKEEMARLAAQRDGAREEVVTLMREVEEKRAADVKAREAEKRVREMEQRYETTLEMLGEKSERVEELMNDVADLKKMYRELVEEKVGR